jgi:glycerol-3-phosphate dehydrogenase
VFRYGSNTPIIIKSFLSAFKENPNGALLAELNYCIDYEMVLSVNDFAIRRSGMLFFDIHRLLKSKAEIIAFMAQKLTWTAERIREEESLLDIAIEHATTFN